MKIVIFKIADKEYGVEISQVLEVKRMKPVTPVPDAADYVEGVISLRGKVIPIINLRIKMGAEKKEIAATDRIILTKVNGDMLGVLVDTVLDVVTFEEGHIVPPDDVLKKAEYLVGVAKLDKRLILIADMQKLISGEARNNIEKIYDRVEVKQKEH